MSNFPQADQQESIQAVAGLPAKRPLPYFQCFASDWMACEDYALMSAAERGLLFSMLNAAWVNGSVPADSANLARIVQLDEPTVSAGLMKCVRKWFTGSAEDPARLICIELERQRRHPYQPWATPKVAIFVGQGLKARTISRDQKRQAR